MVGAGGPRVSVLMAAHNAAPYLRQAIDSVLRQSFADLELILVNDGSTDETADIAAAYRDPRLRVVTNSRNLGVAEARNEGFAVARGTYLAIHDADDISHPTRLARQVEHLDRHPGDVLVATDIRQMHIQGEMVQPRTGGAASRLLLEWMLHLGNPLAFSSAMMRASALRRLPQFLREERRYAEDYDLYVRLLAHGGVARLPVPLVIYRVHPQSSSARHRTRMIEQTSRVMREMWPADVLAGEDRRAAAALIARHLAAGTPADNPDVLRKVRDTLRRLADEFIDSRPDCSAAEREAVMLHAGRLWEYLVRSSLRAGTVTWPSVPGFHRGAEGRLRGRDLLGAALQGMIPRPVVDFLRRQRRPADELEPPEATLATAARGPVAPPVLHVTVVLEGGAAGCDDSRQGAGLIARAQEIFDPYGLRPAYFLDRCVASQDSTCLALRTVHESGGCAIGAWWPEPDKPVSSTDIEALGAAVEAGLGVWPRFAAAEALAQSAFLPACGFTGIGVSTSVVVPLAPALDRAGGAGNRPDLTRAVSLLPDRIASEPQIILIRSLLARGERRFFARLHLRQGDSGNAAALARLQRVCTWFFEELGGLPGDARTLATDRRRRPRDQAPGLSTGSVAALAQA